MGQILESNLKIVDLQGKLTKFYLFEAKSYFDYIKVILKQIKSLFCAFWRKIYLFLVSLVLIRFTRNISLKVLSLNEENLYKNFVESLS